MLKIALPNKGRLAEDARTLFEDAGLELQARGERALTASAGGVFEALFVRAQDIPEFVADGAADAGITGWDLVCESGRALACRLDLGFGRCRLVVAAREDRADRALASLAGARVASPFPRLARAFFEARALPVEVVPVTGAAEAAPHLGIADAVVDLTSTGSTLRVNGLVEIETVMESTARLVVAPALGGAAACVLDQVAAALDSVLRARGQRYVMANVPRTALARVREVLPGLDGPTVVDVLDGGALVAVHAVVPAGAVGTAVAALQQLGARGILVTRIERLVP
jgi:ATP phosphoribosyltransferase